MLVHCFSFVVFRSFLAVEDLLLYCFHLRSLLLETTLGSFFVVKLCDFLAAEIQGKFVILEDFGIELALED